MSFLFACGRAVIAMAVAAVVMQVGLSQAADTASPRQKISINDDWRFTKDDPPGNTTSLLYDVRPQGGRGRGRGAPAAEQPAAEQPPAPPAVIKSWILPTGNDLIKDPAKRFTRPEGNVGGDVAYVKADFDDSAWRKIDLPHDWGIEGPFASSGGGGTGRLPFYGVAWYRKKLDIPASDAGKSIFLEIDGAMSYSAVWLNGQIVGGWPYGYSSWRVDLTPYVKPGGVNQLAIRLDNPANSSRWYPGSGIYRNVWLVKTSPVRVAQWGTYLTTPEVSATSATVNLKTTVENKSKQDANVSVVTQIYALDADGNWARPAVGSIATINLQIPAGKSAVAEGKTTISNPKLWGPMPQQKPNRYVAVTDVSQIGDKSLVDPLGTGDTRLMAILMDTYETPFGIRTLKFDPNEGFSINGQHVKLNGVCDHHDLGALGSAVNYRALERQLQMLVEMGCNAIRTSHNPPTPELLELADRMGIMIMDETFDVWMSQKTQLDYHLVYADWHEQDTRMLVRRDRNHPSVILWSIGNEIGEQGQGEKGAAMAKELSDIVHEEDPTRLTTAAMNSANANSPFPRAMDAAGLNYQGTTGNQYPNFHRNFPDKFVFGSETASTISSRGEYSFPVAAGVGAVANANSGQLASIRQMSSYDLYYPSWATSPDREFASQDRYPFVGGEFVWTGWDYLGEPTPFEASRSSYFGIIDLAGFKKDRFYIYQAYWRPELPMAHLLPHWNWPDRAGQVTPVHLYTSGDEAELFLNDKSLGRKKKEKFQYRIRWDDVVYEPGTLKAVAYKDGKQWATDTVKTTGDAAKLLLQPDRAAIAADGHDLSFVTLTVADKDGLMVPRSKNLIHFTIEGPGEIVATDNGDATDFTVFPSPDRKAFNGLALAIVKAKRGQTGTITVTAKSDGLTDARATITTKSAAQ
jgi:beta-galactosidase